MRLCAVCGTDISHRRKDARTCSERCLSRMARRSKPLRERLKPQARVSGVDGGAGCSCAGRVEIGGGPLTVVAFTVPGLPQPGGSKRAFPNRRTGRISVVDANPRAKPWQAVVAAAGVEAMAGREPFTVPLIVSFGFYLPRPKGHYGTGRNAGVLRDSAPMSPAVKPDLLKLARAAEDALTGVCWRDDALIVAEHLAKKYALGGPHMRVQVRPAVWVMVADARLGREEAAA